MIYGDDSGQAFPIPADEDHARLYGLTKREYFAAQALQGLLSCNDPGVGWAARRAREAADALLAELASPPAHNGDGDKP